MQTIVEKDTDSSLTPVREYLEQLHADQFVAHAKVQQALQTEMVSEAVRRMVELNVGSVIVVSENARVLGLFTERDLLRKIYGANKDPERTLVSDASIMRPVMVAERTHTMADCLGYMLHNYARYVPVVDLSELDQFELSTPSRDHLVGMVSGTQIVKRLAAANPKNLGEESAHSLKHLFDVGYCGLGKRHVLSPRNTLRDVIDIMNDQMVGAMLVGEDDQVVGILSQRDILRLPCSRDAAWLDERVEDHMVTNVTSIGEKSTIHDCLSVFGSKGIGHLPVMENATSCRGILSVRDVLRYVYDGSTSTPVV